MHGEIVLSIHYADLFYDIVESYRAMQLKFSVKTKLK